ncbi:MAG: TonB family protein [Vicinamibacteraceae bacterium]
MSDTPHPRGIGFYRRFAGSTSTPATPAVQANVVWPPPDDEVDRVIGVGRADEPGESPLPGRGPGDQPRPAPDPAESPAAAGDGPPEPAFDFNSEAGGSADAASDEPPGSSAAALSLEAISRSTPGGAETTAHAERHFSLNAAPKPTISVPLAFPPSGERRGRRAGIVGVVAAAAILLFTLPPDVATLLVQSEPAGATVSVNGVGQGETPFEVQLAPGEYVIELRYGGRTWRKPVALRAGVQVVNYFALGDESAPTTAMRPPDARSAADSPLTATRVAKASNTETRPATVRVMAREERPAPRVAGDNRRGWLVVAPSRRLTLLADGELLDLVAAGEKRRFSLAAGDHELELVYVSGLRETRQVRIDAGGVARLQADSPGRAVISTDDGDASSDAVDAQSSDASTAPPRPRDQSLPPLRMAPFPVPENARAVVELQIDEQGRVARATFQRSINNFYDQRLLGAVQNWRYEPALRNGQAVASTDVVEIEPGATEWSIRR